MITRRGLVLALLLAGAAGNVHADYVLRDLDGREHRLSDLQGKWVVINFWATWCPPCIEEMPALEAFHQAHKDRDAVVWGVNFQDAPAQELRAFVERLGVTYPILGQGQSPVTPFGTVKVLPTTFVVDPEGKFARAFQGTVTVADLEAVIAAR